MGGTPRVQSHAMFSFALVVLAQTPAPPAKADMVGAVYVQPVGTIAAAPGEVLFLSFGAQHRVTESLLLHADAALVWSPGVYPRQSEDFPGSTSASFSAGPQFQLAGSGLRGLFLAPKVYGIYSDSHRRPPGAFTPEGTRIRWQTAEFGAGLDLAFQWHFGRFFIGSVVGFSVGYALTPHLGWGLWSTFGGATLWDALNRGTGFALGVNVHLLRLGFAW